MMKVKDAVITVKSVYDGNKTDRQAFIELILQRQQKLREMRASNENNILIRKETVDAAQNMRYNDCTPDMRYTQQDGGKF